MTVRARTVCISICGAVILALALYLIFGAKPWAEGVEGFLASGGKEKDLKTMHHVISGEWYGALVNLGIACVLLGLSCWLTRALGVDFSPGKAAIPAKSRPFFIGATVMAMALGAILNAPRLDSSLWGDEEYTMKRTVVGDYMRSNDGKGDEIRFRAAPWSDTFFRYKSPNNHFVNSIFARVSHELFFKPSDDPQSLHFSETVIRLPTFIAGLAGIAALGWCLAVMGFPRAGIFAMFLLVLHPWFIRYGVDSRGYAYIFPFFPLALGFLIKALRSGRWCFFFLFALFETLLFYSYPGTLYLLLPLNLCAVLVIFFGINASRSDKITLFARWFTSNAAAGMVVIQLMAPTVKPLADYLHRSRAHGEIHLEWARDNLSYLATGIPWAPWESGNPLCEHLSTYAVPATAVMLGCIGILAILGLCRMIRSSRQTLIFSLVFILPWPLLVLHSMPDHRLLYHWYSLIALPGIIMLIALGLEWLAALMPSLRAHNIASAALLLVFGSGFYVFTAGQRAHLREGSVEPLRESVSSTRRVINPEHPDIDKDITIGFCMATRGYDPHAYLFKKDDEAGLRKLMARAKAENKPLCVNLALRGLADASFPKMMAIINDPAIFEIQPPFYGLDQPCTRWVFRLK